MLRRRIFQNKSPVHMGLSWGKERKYFTTQQFSKQVPSQHGPLLGQGATQKFSKQVPSQHGPSWDKRLASPPPLHPEHPSQRWRSWTPVLGPPCGAAPPQNAKSAIAGGRSLRFRMLAARPPCVSAGGRALRSPMLAAVAWAHTSGTEHEARWGKRCRFVIMRGARAGDNTPLRSVPTQNDGSGELPEPIAGVQLFPGGRARQKTQNHKFPLFVAARNVQEPSFLGAQGPPRIQPPSPFSLPFPRPPAGSLSLSLSLSSYSGDWSAPVAFQHRMWHVAPSQEPA